MMPSRLFTTVILVFACANAAPVRAAVDLELGVQGGVGWNSNVFGRTEDELDDFNGRIGPDIRLTDGDGVLHWDFRYLPEYQAYLDFSDLDAWDHDASGNLEWDISPRTNLDLTGRYFDVSSNSLLTDDVFLPDGTLDTALSFRVDRLQRIQMDAQLSHQLDRRNSLLLGLTLLDSNPEEENTSDQRTSNAQLSFNHRLSATDSIGAFVRYSRQVVELEQDDTQTEFYNLSLQWRHNFSPTFLIDVSAGPAWVDSQNQDFDFVARDQREFPLVRDENGFNNVRASTCPTLDNGTPFLDTTCELFPGFLPATVLPTTDLTFIGDLIEPSSNTLTYFASVSLEKRWLHSSLVVRYVRDTDTSNSALATRGSVRDAVTATFRWEPRPRWRFVAVGSWQRTEAAGEGVQFVSALEGVTVNGVPDVARNIGFGAIEVDTKTKIDRYTLSGRLTYEFNPRTDIYLRVFYNKQETSAVSFAREVDRVLVFIGFSHYFTPIPLPI